MKSAFQWLRQARLLSPWDQAYWRLSGGARPARNWRPMEYLMARLAEYARPA